MTDKLASCCDTGSIIYQVVETVKQASVGYWPVAFAILDKRPLRGGQYVKISSTEARTMNRPNRQIEAAELLRQIVEQAVDDGAEMIDFERVPEGLEITTFAGASGVGRVLDDRELEDELIRWVDKNTKVGQGSRGTIEIVVHGGKRTVALQRYESFGETCFRIFLDPDAETFEDDHDELGPVGQCAGCDAFGPIDSNGLCDECGSKLERDLIRQGDWDYTIVGFGLPESERAAYRAKIIAKYGAKMELIADERPSQATRNSQQAGG
jgi:hypothetical protein